MPRNANQSKQSNYSMSFDSASSDKITGTGALISGNESRSFSLWYKTSSTAAQIPFSLGSPTDQTNGSQFAYCINRSSTTNAAIFGKNSAYDTSVFTVPNTKDGNWHHLVVTYDQSALNVYIDGNLEATPALPSTSYITSAGFSIGGWSVNDRKFNGQIDGVSVFNYALTDGTGGTVNQIAALYGSSSTGIGNPMSLSPKPVAYYPLGDQDAFNGSNYLVPNSSLKDYVFDFTAGIDEYINLGNNSVLQPASNYTFSIWFNADSYSYKTLFGSNTSTSSGVLALPISNNTMSYYHAHSGTAAQSFNISLTDAPLNNWHNFIVTWSASTGIIRAFINGKFKKEITGINDINWGNELLIGRYYQTYPFLFDGKLSNFAMWNTTLTDGFSGTPTSGDVAGGQVAEVYNNGNPQTTITGSPVGWWKLDASDTYDSSTGNWTIEDHAGSNDGTSSGMTQANLVQSDLSFTSGYSPYALDFNGTDQAINLNSAIALTGNRSVNFWFTWRTSGIYLGGATSGVYYPYILSTTSVYLKTSGIANTVINIPALQVGVFYNMCITGDGTTVSIYINGSLAGTGTDIANITLDTIANTKSPTTNGVNGNMSNVAIWNNTVLSQSEVTEIYNSGVPSNLNTFSGTAPTSWWQLGSNSSFNTNWICADEKGTNNGTSANMGVDALTNGVGTTANGTSSGMAEGNLVGDAPYSTANAISTNMVVTSRVTGSGNTP